MRDLPEWVWQLVEGFIKYEDEHGLLYRMDDDGGYERTECFGTTIKGVIPLVVTECAEVMRSRRITAS